MEGRAYQDGKTSFCKIILKGQPTDYLRIPPQFLKHLSKEALKGVTLNGPSGNYQAKLCKNGEDMCLGHGWDQFARDNSLGSNEFLIFNYNGAIHFQVQIFDPNGRERINFSGTRKASPESTSRPRSKHHGQEPRLKKKESQRARIKEEEEIDQAPIKRNASQRTWIKEEEEMDRTPIKKKESQRTWIKEEEEEEEMDRTPIKKKGRAKKTDSPLPVPVPVPFSSDLPHFWVQMGVNQVERVFIVPVPAWFSEAYLAGDRTEMTLRNREEKSWKVNCISTLTKRNLCGGWSAFARHNKLKAGDVCVFELVGCNKMQVHVYPSEESD